MGTLQLEILVLRSPVMQSMITPTAFEEANGSGSGTYTTTDFGSGIKWVMVLK